MEELAKLLGLGSPVAAAGAIYWLFSFLDKKASDEANQAVASWMKGESYERIDLGKAVIGAFDHIYGAPLFRLTAFYRSALLSVFTILLWNLLVYASQYPLADWARFLLLVAPTTIVVDYLSLYIIRRSLKIATTNITLSLVMSVILAFIAICIIVDVSATIGLLIESGSEVAMNFIQFDSLYFWFIPATYTVFAPAFLVHLWLPLFLIGALLNRGLSAFFHAAGLAQRFMKHGDEHPFDAIGIVAATVVFVVTAVWTIGSHFI